MQFPSWLPARSHREPHTYIHTCMHACMHAYIQRHVSQAMQIPAWLPARSHRERLWSTLHIQQEYRVCSQSGAGRHKYFERNRGASVSAKDSCVWYRSYCEGMLTHVCVYLCMHACMCMHRFARRIALCGIDHTVDVCIRMYVFMYVCMHVSGIDHTVKVWFVCTYLYVCYHALMSVYMHETCACVFMHECIHMSCPQTDA